MLRAKQIPAFLEQATTEGMRCILLLQADGQVVGSAGPGIGVVHHQIMGVISSGMWGEFDGAGGDLQMMLMGMDNGTLGVARCGTGHLICVNAEAWVKMGLIRAKLAALSKALDAALAGLDG